VHCIVTRHHVTAEASEQRAWELQEESKHRAAEANAAMLHAAAAELQAKKLELKGCILVYLASMTTS
jgi:hypothetical protein